MVFLCYQLLMSKNKTLISSLILVISVVYAVRSHTQEIHPVMDEMVILAPLPLTHSHHSVPKNSSVHESLVNAGVEPQLIYEIVKAAKSEFNLRHIQPGTKFTISRMPDLSVKRITFDISPLSRLEINYSHQEWTADINDIETTKQLVHFNGIVKDSLWGSGLEQKLSPEVIVDFAEVFGWQVDFSREVQKGDRWQLSVEKLMAEGRFVGWGPILYAEYQSKDNLFKAYHYQNKKDNIQGYFDEEGQSLRKVFLKSPIKFGRITSRFSRRRFHPIHKTYRAHNGVDYGAPRGTPVRAVGDGRVVKIGRFGGSGNMIILDHVAGFETKYLHLNRFQKGLRRGSVVRQAQVIGYVGSTGYATGPHLHFEMSKHRQIIDPLKVNLPSSKPVPQAVLAHFKQYIGKVGRKIASSYEAQENGKPCCDSTPIKTIKSTEN